MLQRTAGNLAVTNNLGVLLQRDRPPSTTERLTALEKQVRVQAKKEEASQLDLLYRARFGGVIADYEQVVYRLGAGFQAGLSAFGQTNTDQAQTDAVRAQLIGAVIAVGAAALFEPFLFPMLAKIRPSLAGAKEAIENPFNAAVAGAVAAGATAAANTAANEGRPATPPGPSDTTTAQGVAAAGDPLSFQSSNLEELAHQRAGFEAAFVTRSTTTTSWTDDQWLGFDRAAQENIYAQKLTGLKKYPAVDKLKSAAEIGTIIEKLLWAQWVQQNAFSTPFMSDTRGQQALTLRLGGEREARFAQLGIASAAGVQFHWYGNRPDDWQQRLLTWAEGYSEHLSTG